MFTVLHSGHDNACTSRVFCCHRYTRQAIPVGMQGAVFLKKGLVSEGWVTDLKHAVSDCHLQVGLCVQHVCISSLWQDRLSGGDLPLFSFLLRSQMPSVRLMLKPNSRQREWTKTRVTILSFCFFCGGGGVQELSFFLNMIWDCFPLPSTYLTVFFLPSDITKCSFMTRCDQLAVNNQKKACDSMYPQRDPHRLYSH